MQQKKIKIIGGGIAGLSTALALKTLGMKYELFEQNAEITYDIVGLGISANIFPLLEKWDILEETRQIGAAIKNFYFVDSNLKYLKSYVMKSEPLSVNRPKFHQLLHNQLDVQNIHLNTTKTVSDFPESDIVVSAEGIHSKTRTNYYPQLNLRDSNQILWRGIAEINLDKQFENGYHDFVGKNLRFAIIHTGQNYYSWYAIKEKNQTEDYHSPKQTLLRLFKNYHPIVSQVIDQTDKIYFSELKDINPSHRNSLNWFVKNNLMLGDAIHPTTPNMANGACLAMEDAYLLAYLLKNRSESIESLFKEFQNRRSKKVNPIVNQSWQLGKMMHQNNAILDCIIKLGMKSTPQFLFDRIYSKILIEEKELLAV